MADVTVLILARNAGRTIDAAIGSALLQTCRPADVIVVDCGSTDDTAHRVTAFGEAVLYVKGPAGGRLRALQAGLSHARGDLIAFLDPSDLWMPRTLEQQLDYLDRHPSATLVHGDTIESRTPAATLLDSPDVLPLKSDATALAADGPTTLAPIVTSTVVVRREALSVVVPGLPGADDVSLDSVWRAVADRGPVGAVQAPLAIVRRPGKARVPRETTPADARGHNLLYDTTYRRLRSTLTNAVHAVDDLVSRQGGGRRRVLFEAASPMSMAVFGPVFRELRHDPRLEFWFTSCDSSWNAQAIFAGAGIRDRVVSAAAIEWAKFDAYINTDFWDMTWVRRRTRRVHLFHGVAGKYGLDAPVKIAPIVATFDRLLFPNRDRLRRYAEAGLVQADSPQAQLIGYPKVDCLVDGSMDRTALMTRLGLDPARPTVLYAPTWSPYSSLNVMGRDVIPALGRLGVNVIVKLHDRSYDTAARGSGGIDWRRRLGSICARHGAHLAQEADASPYLFVADLLVTDHSSVGFEYMLLDRPLVVIDSPELIANARVNPDRVTQLQGAAFVVRDRCDVAAAVREGLAHAQHHGPQRRAVAGDLFYCPGSATTRAVQCIYDLLGVAAPVAASDARPAQAITSFATLARGL